MSFLSFLTGCAALLGQAAEPPATPPPVAATIVPDKVEVRSGPSSEYYPTGELLHGAEVRIVKEENGWLGIEPPPGSFSWIHNRVVKQIGPTELVVVPLEGVPVRMGSRISSKKPEVIGAHLERGTQVTIVGGPVSLQTEIPEEGGKWWQIKPLNELRWIPKDAVRLTPAVETVVSAAPEAAKPGGPQDLWNQAEQAERAGDLPRAMQLYAAAAGGASDRDLQMRCYNRIQFLRDGNHGSTPPGYQAGRSNEAATGEFRPVANSGGVVVATPVSQSQAVGYGPRPPGTQTTNPGRLRRAGFYVDGKQAYVLDDSQGRPQIYATAQPGVNLEPFINRIVTLSGAISYRGDLRTNYIATTQANALP